jgi:hypothetical protein
LVWIISQAIYVKYNCPNNHEIQVCPHMRVIRSKNYRGYVKPRIVPNAIDNVINIHKHGKV